MPEEIQEEVGRLLHSLDGVSKLRELLTLLNYDYASEPVPKTNWPEKVAQQAKDIKLIARRDDFQVIYSQIDRLNLIPERQIVNQLLRIRPYCLVVFSDSSQRNWHFVNVKPDKDQVDLSRKRRKLFRRIVVGPDERLRTAAERISKLDLGNIQRDLLGGIPPLEIQKLHDEAFDVESVTRKFFEDYKKVFDKLLEHLHQQTGDFTWAHDYALQLLNRVMFLYFIQRKRWLGDDPEFVRNFWQAYLKSGQASNTFFDHWLSVLFFEAFNSAKEGKFRNRPYLPEEIDQDIKEAPWLNGGLFLENELDRKYKSNLSVSDDEFADIFEFLDHYNFTIREDSPFDQEVAVDPEMIGKVYESLVNIKSEEGEEEDQGGAAGIFYTPRIEIDLMCRLSLVDWLSNHLGEALKPRLYEAVLAYEEEEKESADQALAGENLWPQLNDLLQRVTVLDPACGSGSFLVGMLMVLDNLQKRANRQLGNQETSYERRKRIIGRSLYGVDVMPWAVHVAELRLWLQLVIETEIAPAERQLRPLLPNLSFKVRPGDSLVQELGGINLGLHQTHLDIPPPLKGKLTQLKGEKRKYYYNDPEARFQSEERLKQEELNLFRQILEAKQQELVNKLKAKVEAGKQTQIGMLGREAEETTQEDYIEALAAEIKRIEEARGALRADQPVPFVWNIAFVEIFEGEEKGFDIVVGNPPYVNKEKISPPDEKENKHKAEEWRRMKSDYKSKLQRSLALAYPRFFQYRPNSGTFRKPDGKSDLYIYFYFHGLSLLNPKGSFCFITSNSWLDAGYGKELQQFLLKHSQVKKVIDNQVKRSFARSDVNSVIVLLARPDERKDWGLNKNACFVTFKVPFETVLSPVVFEEIEEATERRTTQEYRVYPVSQRTLYEEGLEVPEEDDKKRKLTKAKYAGNKWGGKYLRAPEIFYTILEKGKGKLVRLGKIAEVNEGRPTGANDFFYLPKLTAMKFNIEEKFLYPGLMKTRSFNRFVIKSTDIDRYFVAIDAPRGSLKGTQALRYIQYGEKQGLHHRNTFAKKQAWYRFKLRPPAELLAPCGLGSTFFCAINAAKAVASNSYAEFRLKSSKDLLPIWVMLNSPVFWLQIEIMGRSSLGGGMLKVDPIEYRQLLVAEPALFNNHLGRIEKTFRELEKRHVMGLFDEVNEPCRRELDKVVCEVLSLTEQEQLEVYRVVVELVKNRLAKAKSV